MIPYTGNALKLYDKLKMENGMERSYFVNKLYAVNNTRLPSWIYINSKGFLHVVIEKENYRFDYLLTTRCTFKEISREKRRETA